MTLHEDTPHEDDDLEARVSALLSARDPAADDLHATLDELFTRYRQQQRLLDRLTHISDRFQRAERDRGHNYLKKYERKVRQLDKIIRISDQYQEIMRELNERLHTLSTHDELTDLPNRRYMLERIESEICHIERHGGTFCIALADLDHFKTINDTHGHVVGDAVLVHVAHALRGQIRDYDECARWGGEEFLFLFPRSSADVAFDMAERLRKALIAPIDIVQGQVGISVSIGITEFKPEDSLDRVLVRVDQALYQAKTAGRDQVAVI